MQNMNNEEAEKKILEQAKKVVKDQRGYVLVLSVTEAGIGELASITRNIDQFSLTKSIIYELHRLLELKKDD